MQTRLIDNTKLYNMTWRENTIQWIEKQICNDITHSQCCGYEYIMYNTVLYLGSERSPSGWERSNRSCFEAVSIVRKLTAIMQKPESHLLNVAIHTYTKK